VSLFFAELYYSTTGARTMRVVVEGQDLTGAEIDVAALAGNQLGFAVRLDKQVEVKDGNLSIRFHKLKQNPIVNAIAIRLDQAYGTPVEEPTVAPIYPGYVGIEAAGVLRIKCGLTSTYTDDNLLVWSPYTPYSFGALAYSTYATGNRVYDSECFWKDSINPQGLNIDLPLGKYTIRLFFIEIAFQFEGQRTFDVLVNDQDVQAKGMIDIVKLAGGSGKLTHMDKDVTLDASNVVDPLNPNVGRVEIRVKKGVYNPKITAIAVIPISEAPTEVPTEAPTGA
jgi:hypothetical protein